MLEFDEERNREDSLFRIGYQTGYAIGVYRGLVGVLRDIYREEEKKAGPEQAGVAFFKKFGEFAFAEELLHFIRKYPTLSNKKNFIDRLAAETEYFPGDI